MRRQCELLGVNRSSLDYVPKGESEFNLAIMRMIDEAHTKMPFYGRRRMREVRRWGREGALNRT